MAAFLHALRPGLIYLGWFHAAVATFGSLFFSEIMKLPPCVLCWYQRVAMYPLVPILAVSILRKDSGAKAYGLPLAVVGLTIATYHNLLYYKFIPDSIKPCTSGVSCTARQLEWLGFITIPLLSLIAFLIVTLCLILAKPETKPSGEFP